MFPTPFPHAPAEGMAAPKRLAEGFSAGAAFPDALYAYYMYMSDGSPAVLLSSKRPISRKHFSR